MDVRDYLNPFNPLGLFLGEFKEVADKQKRINKMHDVPAPTKKNLILYLTSCLAYAGFLRDEFPKKHFAMHSVESNENCVVVQLGDDMFEIIVRKKYNKSKEKQPVEVTLKE
jgi:hypothetical protein